MTAERLVPIAKRLEAGATPEECERVLRHYAREAAKRPKAKLKWFNGETNWRKDNFGRALGMADASGPRLSQAERERRRRWGGVAE